jgi:hypothetical protein
MIYVGEDEDGRMDVNIIPSCRKSGLPLGPDGLCMLVKGTAGRVKCSIECPTKL